MADRDLMAEKGRRLMGGGRPSMSLQLRTIPRYEIGEVRKEITVPTRWLPTVVAATILIPMMQRVLAFLMQVWRPL